METLRLLAIFAHPDDESMGMGGALAKYAVEGVETYLICATRGERGWFGPEDERPGLSELGQLRARELEDAVRVLGIKEFYFLDYLDGEVAFAPYAEIIGKIASHIRRIQPQVVVTFPPDGNYGHPDHIAIGQFASAAIIRAADVNYKISEGASPHCVSKLYYMVDTESFVNLISPFLGDMSFRVGDEIRGEFPWKDWMATTRIETLAYCKTAWRAIQCHKSQLAALGALAEAPEEDAALALAMQGTFYRVFSLVNGGMQIETDLFAGLR